MTEPMPTLICTQCSQPLFQNEHPRGLTCITCKPTCKRCGPDTRLVVSLTFTRPFWVCRNCHRPAYHVSAPRIEGEIVEARAE